jgi:hypothetical protein
VCKNFENGAGLKVLIKVCSSETCIKAQIGKHLSGTFPIKNGLKQRIFLITIVLCFCIRICHEVVASKPGGVEIECNTSAFGLC